MLLEEKAFMLLIFQKNGTKIIMLVVSGDDGKRESMQAIYSTKINVISWAGFNYKYVIFVYLPCDKEVMGMDLYKTKEVMGTSREIYFLQRRHY